MTLAQFGKDAKRLQYFVFAIPFISKLFDRHAGWPFPPMGDKMVTWRLVAMCIVGASLLIPHPLLPQKRRELAIGCLFVLMIVSGAIYLNLQDKLVITIRNPNGAITFVTRGDERVSTLREPYASMTDDDLIRHAGTSDSDLEHAYTSKSLRSNRQMLFWSYVFFLASLELLLGSIARVG